MFSEVGIISAANTSLLGEHYTPANLAQYIVNTTFCQILKNQSKEGLMNKKILELGVGNGAFLLSTAKFLDTKFKSESFNDPVEERRKIVQNNLYGVDFNSNAVEFCRNQLKSWIIGTNKADLRTNQNISINNVLND
ncbi:MAG: N-6 DNA methylase, partial [Candidatus Hodarchaeales archaeon]